jgi:uncharacterized protein (TIGR03086 family)
VPPEAFALPTPCSDWDVAHLVEHVVAACRVYLWTGQRPYDDPKDALADPHGAWAQARDCVQAAFDDPASADGEYDFRLGRMSLLQAMDVFLSTDVLIHGWDLATATGPDATLPAAEVAAMLPGVTQAAPLLRSTGAFGSPVEVPDDADDQTKLLALFGRRV